MEDTCDLEKYMADIETDINMLANAGEDMGNAQRVHYLFNGLPDSYTTLSSTPSSCTRRCHRSRPARTG